MRIRWRYAAAAITLAFAALSVLPSDWLAPVYAAPVYAAPAKKGKKAAPKKDPPAQNAVVVDPLPYSLSYTITGNYRVGTVDFVPTETNGFQTDVIQMTGDSAVPPGATIVAAWLYWETIWGLPEEIEGAQFRGQDITLARGVDLPLSGSLSPCWSNGGGNLTMLRADVLSLLADELGLDGNPTGRRLVNDADLTAAGLPLHTVTLPERGEGNQTPQRAPRCSSSTDWRQSRCGGLSCSTATTRTSAARRRSRGFEGFSSRRQLVRTMPS